MIYSPNYKFNIPEYDDPQDIEPISDNFAVLDTELNRQRQEDTRLESEKATKLALAQHAVASPLDHPDGSVTDAKLGSRTVLTTSGTLQALLTAIGNAVKAITGGSAWNAAPATTLAAAKTHSDDATRHLTAPERVRWNDTYTQAQVDAKDKVIQDSVTAHDTDAARHITAAERTTWSTVDSMLPLAGGTLTGALLLSGAPTQDLQAVTKKYADDLAISTGGGDMLKSVYDTNNNGKVDTAENAETVNNLTVLTAVPVDAKFTDTIFTHPSSGATAGTYRSVAINAQGHVTGGTNPTTLAGYGITDAERAFAKNNAFNKSFGTAAGTVCQGNDARLTNARPASGGTSAACSGNAATATNASNDEDGRNISSTYATVIRASGNSLELTSRYGGAISSVVAPYASSANYATNAYQASGGKLMVGTGKIQSPVTQQLYLSASGGEPTNEIFLGVLESAWRFCPMGNNAVGFGSPSKRWRDLYLVNAPNVSSDRRLKQDITTLDGRYTQLLLRLPACRYKLISDSTSGYRCGFIAQDVEALLAELKLAPEEFTALVKSPVFKDVQVIEFTQTQDPEGDIVETETLADRQLIVPEEYTYSLRYEEFIAPLLALVQAQQAQIAHLEAAQEALQAEQKALSARLAALEGA